MSNIRATFSINAAGTVWGAIDGDISNQTDLQDALDLKADKSELETDIEEVNTAISNLSDTVTSNYNTLDGKIDSEISNRQTADEDLQDNIDTLGDTVTDNYTELNNKILDNTADITTNTGLITNINSKIPEQASAVNQLADKNFVNSSIATNTANFIGTFNSIAELEAYSGTLTNNDYAFVATTDSVGNTLYDRYKWNGSEWLFEYELNNSSFTANQWASINSGITDTLTAQITTNQNSITNIQNNYVPKTRTINGKALNTNITLNASDVNALANTTTINDLTTTAQQNALNSGATSAKISQITTNTNNIATINDKIPADASSSNKLVTASALSNAVVNLANQDLSNLTETGNDRLHALKGYEDAGELLTDAEGLANVKRYAHSTFDLSKFTVVGSPNITDDGIASWDGSPNNFWRAETPITLSQLQDKSWTFRDEWINKGITQRPSDTTKRTQEGIIIASGSAAYGLVCVYGDGSIGFTGRFGDLEDNTGSAQIIAIAKTWSALGYSSTPASAEVELSFDITTGIYTLRVRVEDETEWKTVGTYTPPTTNKQLWAIYNNPDRLIRFSENTVYNNVYNALDLKYASIVIDGVEVFSGNRTGIDTIKPDNYTVVGTPTISADGVLNTSSGNYLTKDLSILNGKTDIVFYSPIATILSAPSENTGLWGNTRRSGEFQIESWLQSNGNVYTVIYKGNQGADQIMRVHSDNMVGHSIQYKITYKNNNWTIYHSIDGGEFTQNGLTVSVGTNPATDSTSILFNSSYPWGIGVDSSTGSEPLSTYGSIDLNSFKIYVDGNLVYQPCLKIPYTQSKTGSKIVNAIYRGRVNDMAEQFGYAPYYILQEDKVGNYSVVGSPTISGDFVASGFSSSNYISKSIELSDFVCEFNVKLNGALATDLIYFYTNDTTRLVLYPRSSTNTFSLYINGGATYEMNPITDWNGEYDGILTKNGTTINLKLYQNGALVSERTVTYTETISAIKGFYLAPQKVFASSSFTGSIDLNSFKIYANNKLTYQAVIDPCFTLPQVELYGLIGDKTLRDSYYNGVTYWELFSNRRLEQGGSCESGVEYTLPKPFADANYVLTIPYSSKTATSFIPSATGDFIAKGTGLL